MADIKIRKVVDRVVATHRSRAEAAGHSLEEELRRRLTEAASRPPTRFARRAARLREDLQRRYGLLPDTTALIRDDRHARG
ncbi:MAG TPA: plasmid stabilization protein [Thermodesulfobacteriota bacterium]